MELEASPALRLAGEWGWQAHARDTVDGLLDLEVPDLDWDMEWFAKDKRDEVQTRKVNEWWSNARKRCGWSGVGKKRSKAAGRACRAVNAQILLHVQSPDALSSAQTVDAVVEACLADQVVRSPRSGRQLSPDSARRRAVLADPFQPTPPAEPLDTSDLESVLNAEMISLSPAHRGSGETAGFFSGLSGGVGGGVGGNGGSSVSGANEFFSALSDDAMVTPNSFTRERHTIGYKRTSDPGSCEEGWSLSPRVKRINSDTLCNKDKPVVVLLLQSVVKKEGAKATDVETKLEEDAALPQPPLQPATPPRQPSPDAALRNNMYFLM